MAISRSFPEIPGTIAYDPGSAREFRRPGPAQNPLPWEAVAVDASIDTRLAGTPDHPEGKIPTYVPMARLDPRSVFAMRPA